MEIRELRKRKGMKQNELAKSLNITSAYLCELEKKKKTNPSIDLITRIANVLEVSVDEILFESGNQKDAS